MLLEEHEYQLCRDKGADSIRNTLFNTVPNIILNWIVFRLVLSNGLPSRFTIAFSLIKKQGIMPYLHNFTQSGTETYTTMLLSYIQNRCTLFEKRQKICTVYHFSRNDFHPIHIDMRCCETDLLLFCLPHCFESIYLTLSFELDWTDWVDFDKERIVIEFEHISALKHSCSWVTSEDVLVRA